MPEFFASFVWLATGSLKKYPENKDGLASLPHSPPHNSSSIPNNSPHSPPMAGAVPNIKFGIGFCESSGECLVRVDGNDDELKKCASENALNIGAGHCFVIVIKNAYPINILNAIKNIQEVCNIYCATANPVEVVLAESQQGRGVIGVIDGSRPKGIEGPDGIKWRKEFLRKIGYKVY